MSKNPLYNALAASSYIVLLVSSVNFVVSNLGDNFEETMLLPMSALSILVLSVSLMAYLFFYQPAILLLDGHREKALKFFLETVAVFAGLTAVVVTAAFVVGYLIR